MEIKLLENNPAVVRTIAEWHQAKWEHLSDQTLEDRIAEIGRHSATVPLTLVAFDGTQPVGAVSLVQCDLGIWPHLTPWMSNEIVLPEYRLANLTKELYQEAIDRANRLNIDTLYYWTRFREDYLTALGWRQIGTASPHFGPIKIMKLNLTPGGAGT